MPREGVGSNKDGKHYWLTPDDLLKDMNSEFHFDFDACPFPRPDGFDGLTADWGQSTYVNPPFSGPTAWVRKAMGESEKGKKVVFVFPVHKWILMLLTHPNFKEVRNLKDVKWCAIEDGSPGKGIGQHIAMFVLDGTLKQKPIDRCTKIPMDKAKKAFDGAMVITDKWWSVVDNCILFYGGYSPQCNSDKRITEMNMKKLYPGGRAVFIPVVYVEHRCEL